MYLKQLHNMCLVGSSHLYWNTPSAWRVELDQQRFWGILCYSESVLHESRVQVMSGEHVQNSYHHQLKEVLMYVGPWFLTIICIMHLETWFIGPHDFQSLCFCSTRRRNLLLTAHTKELSGFIYSPAIIIEYLCSRSVWTNNNIVICSYKRTLLIFMYSIVLKI